MAFTNGNSNSRPITFASFNSKEGVFVLKDKEGNKNTYSQVRDITVQSLRIEADHYEGQPLRKLRIRASNTDGDVSITFNMAAGATAKLVALLANADVSAPLGMSQSLCFQGVLLRVVQAKPAVKAEVSIPLFSGRITAGRGRLFPRPPCVSIPLFSGRITACKPLPI